MRALSYHPLFDPHHCAFRTLAFLEYAQIETIPIDAARIIDLFHLFPTLITDVRLPRHLRPLRTSLGLKKVAQPYATLPSQKTLYRMLTSIHDVAFRSMVSKAVFDKEEYVLGKLSLCALPESGALLAAMHDHQGLNDSLLQLLRELADLPLLGADGLKSRSGVMEYRYDVI